MKVRYIHGDPGRWASNILWSGKYPANGGRFPRDHPCAAGTEMWSGAGDGQFGNGEALKRFRDRGYWASCFPEGDGITMKCLKDQSAEQVKQDIKEAFGWKAS